MDNVERIRKALLNDRSKWATQSRRIMKSLELELIRDDEGKKEKKHASRV